MSNSPVVIIDVREIWGLRIQGQINCSKFCKSIYKTLKEYSNIIQVEINDYAKSLYNELLEELKESSFNDLSEFDFWWDAFYDSCDNQNILIKTID